MTSVGREAGRRQSDSGRRLGGVLELSLGVFERSEACVRTSKGGKARLGKASQRCCDRMGDGLGDPETPPTPLLSPP